MEMNREKFKELLKLAGINKKEFAEICATPYGSVNNWGNVRNPFPNWVEPFILNYIELQQLKNAAATREKLAAIASDSSNLKQNI